MLFGWGVSKLVIFVVVFPRSAERDSLLDTEHWILLTGEGDRTWQVTAEATGRNGRAAPWF